MSHVCDAPPGCGPIASATDRHGLLHGLLCACATDVAGTWLHSSLAVITLRYRIRGVMRRQVGVICFAIRFDANVLCVSSAPCGAIASDCSEIVASHSLINTVVHRESFI